jgi:perosamine synthetase
MQKIVQPPSQPVAAGTPVPLSEPYLGGREWEYVKDCLDTNWVSSVGSYVGRFEEAIASRAGVPFGVATASGTAALHVALLVAGVRPEDEVITSTLTFIASVNAIRYAGGHPVLIDAEPKHWQMDADLLAAFLRERCQRDAKGLRNRATGRRVTAVLPVHILGHPAEMRRIAPLAAEYGLALVEDATESLGARCGGRPVGSLGRLACFSFNGNKLITTGGGGMIVSADETLARSARHLTTQARTDTREYIHDEVGFNYRLTNIQAALGVAQCEQLDHHIARKRAIAGHYDSALAGIPGITTPRRADWAVSADWLYTVEIDPELFGSSARDLMQRLARHNVQTRPVWQPMHMSAPHRGCERVGGEVAERIYERALSLPCSVGLTNAQRDRVVEEIRLAAA